MECRLDRERKLVPYKISVMSRTSAVDTVLSYVRFNFLVVHSGATQQANCSFIGVRGQRTGNLLCLWKIAEAI